LERRDQGALGKISNHHQPIKMRRGEGVWGALVGEKGKEDEI